MLRYVILGRVTYLIHVYVYILCIAHPISVCGNDQIICYPGVEDLTGEPGDT